MKLEEAPKRTARKRGDEKIMEAEVKRYVDQQLAKLKKEILSIINKK